MLSILNKLTLQKKLQNLVTNNVFLDKKEKHINNKTKKSNMKTLPGAGNWIRVLSDPKRVRYLFTTESIESNYCSQAI